MQVKNISGGPLNFPAAGKDVEDGEIVEVPDDTVLPAAYFEKVDTTKAAKTSSTKE